MLRADSTVGELLRLELVRHLSPGKRVASVGWDEVQNDLSQIEVEKQFDTLCNDPVSNVVVSAGA